MNAENADSTHFLFLFFQEICAHLRFSASNHQSVGWLGLSEITLNRLNGWKK
jgi:hypothetical protein